MIEDGDHIILKRESSMRVVHAKKNGRPFVFDKVKFRLDNIFGKPYGSQFEADKKTGQLVCRREEFSVSEALPETSSGQDNRNLISANDDNQSLGKDEIHALRKDGLTGDEVMTELIKNSTTFTQKTKFSQEKWIKKKKKRHMNVYTVLKPCTRLIAEMYYQRDAAKICFLRLDTLAQVLTLSNIQANSKVLLVESCQGLVAGAILDRLADEGCLVQLFTTANPMKGRTAFDDFGFSKELTKSRMKLYPLNCLHELSVFGHEREVATAEQGSEAKRRKLESDSSPPLTDINRPADDEEAQLKHKISTGDREPSGEMPPAVKDDQPSEQPRGLPPHLKERAAAKTFIENSKFDTLVVAVKAHPTQLVLRLLNLVKLSRPFVVFHPHKEPLMELFVQLKERGGVVNLKLSETWYRSIQVLPERTHPLVNMSGTSGYLLTGTTVQ